MQRKVGDPLGRSEEDGGIYCRRRASFFLSARGEDRAMGWNTPVYYNTTKSRLQLQYLST